MDKMGYPSRKPTRLKTVDYASANEVFFLTLSTRRRQRVFAQEEFNAKVIDTITSERHRLGHAVYVYCLMPDHIHLLSSPLESGISVSQFVGGLSSRITRLSWKQGLSGTVMQRSFYDHVVRQDEDLMTVAQYILNNPVRKGMVEDWQAYPYCGLLDPLP